MTYDFTIFFFVFQKIAEKKKATIEEGMIVEEMTMVPIVDIGIMVTVTVTEIQREIEVIVEKTGKSKLLALEETTMAMVILRLHI